MNKKLFITAFLARRTEKFTAKSKTEAREIIRKYLNRLDTNMITTCIGYTDQEVMPFTWTSRQQDDSWSSHPGDAKRLGMSPEEIGEEPPQIFTFYAPDGKLYKFNSDENWSLTDNGPEFLELRDDLMEGVPE